MIDNMEKRVTALETLLEQESQRTPLLIKKLLV
jgi:hypothetical protein